METLASVRSPHFAELKEALKMKKPSISNTRLKKRTKKWFLCFSGSFRTEQSLKYL